MIAQVVLAVLLAWLLLWVEHWFPWQLMLGRELPRPAAYVLGVLALMLPFSGLLAVWGEWLALAALWAVIVAGGAAVIGAYAIDRLLETRSKVKEQDELIQVLRRNGTDG